MTPFYGTLIVFSGKLEVCGWFPQTRRSEKPCSSVQVSSDRLDVHGRSPSLRYRYWSTEVEVRPLETASCNSKPQAFLSV